MAAPVSVPLLHTLPPCRIRASVPRCCTRYRKSCFWCWPRRSPGQTTSSRRRCGEPSIWRSSDGSTATTAASPAMIRCATCSRPWTRSCSSPAFWPGSTAYQTMTRTSSRLTARPLAQPRQAKGPQPLAPRVGLGGTAADRARAAGDRGEIQRDHRDSAVAEASRPEGCSGHHGCHGDTDRHRPRDPRRGGDYCMSLKKNWPAVHAEVEELFTHRQTV